MKMDDTRITGEGATLFARDLETWWRKSFMPGEGSQVWVRLPNGDIMPIVSAHLDSQGDLMFLARAAAPGSAVTAPSAAADGSFAVLASGRRVELTQGQVSAIRAYLIKNGRHGRQWHPDGVMIRTRDLLISKGVFTQGRDGVVRFAPGVILPGETESPGKGHHPLPDNE